MLFTAQKSHSWALLEMSLGFSSQIIPLQWILACSTVSLPRSFGKPQRAWHAENQTWGYHGRHDVAFVVHQGCLGRRGHTPWGEQNLKSRPAAARHARQAGLPPHGDSSAEAPCNVVSAEVQCVRLQVWTMPWERGGGCEVGPQDTHRGGGVSCRRTKLVQGGLKENKFQRVPPYVLKNVLPRAGRNQVLISVVLIGIWNKEMRTLNAEEQRWHYRDGQKGFVAPAGSGRFPGQGEHR